MGFPLSPQSIGAVADVISGGPSNTDVPPVGIYRTGPEIERFMLGCNVEYRNIGSRYPTLVERLTMINNGPDAESRLRRVIEASANPSDFRNTPDKLDAVIQHLNSALHVDGLAVRRYGHGVRLIAVNDASPAVGELANKAATINFDSVQLGLQRALENLEHDPEDAITAACSTVESVCKSILAELGITLPSKRDVQGLYKAVKRPLGLNPDRTDWDADTINDVRLVLGGLASAVQGIGALRTHSGDAHGATSGTPRVDTRIARFAVNSASAVALFLIETWERKYPQRVLHEASAEPKLARD